MYKLSTKKMIEKLLPEPQPNSEPMLMCIATAPILQNHVLGEVYSSSGIGLLVGASFVINFPALDRPTPPAKPVKNVNHGIKNVSL